MLFVCATPGCLTVDNTGAAGVLPTDPRPTCRWCQHDPPAGPRRRYDPARHGPMDPATRTVQGEDWREGAG